MELISKDDAIAVAMYSKDPVEGIKNLPTVDPAAEVRHGRWEGDEPGDWHCSHCGEYAADGGFEQTKYCPNCGARMDGGHEDG